MDAVDVAGRAVHSAVPLVTGAQAATVTASAGKKIITLASTSPDGAAFDRALSTAGGPVWSSTQGQTPVVHSADLTVDHRWPLIGVDGAVSAVRSLLSFALFPAPKGQQWALNLYADHPYAFGPDCEHLGRLLSTHVAVAMTAAHQRANLQRGVASRDLIGQAKGILIERYRITADQAFTYLTRVSQSSNRKLHDIAAELALTGQLPDGQAPTQPDSS